MSQTDHHASEVVSQESDVSPSRGVLGLTAVLNFFSICEFARGLESETVSIGTEGTFVVV